MLIKDKNSRILVALTGASGHMGRETLRALMLSDKNYIVRILSLKTIRDIFFVIKNKIKYGDRLEVVFGDIRSSSDCERLVKGADYVQHLAAIIPPTADHRLQETIEVNYDGTVNLVNAVKKEESLGKTLSFVHISTVALYGERNLEHPWGRVGDPVIPSVFDVYAQSKASAERYVLESGLKKWMVLRQSGILYPSLLIDNVSDGLMFHTCWNTPIEWSSDVDCGTLMKNIVDYDLDKKKGGWYGVYNIGGGAPMRTTGYGTFDHGFKLIGGSAESFFMPYYNKDRNFHCIWYLDSQKLEDLYHFRRTSFDDFWRIVKKKYPFFSLARLLPAKLIKALVVDPLRRTSNAPEYWIKHRIDAKVIANFKDGYDSMNRKKSWENQPVLDKNLVTEDGYGEKEFLDEDGAISRGLSLDIGYDADKNVDDFTIDDIKKIAEFRGGRCLSDSFLGADDRLTFECSEGHRFETTLRVLLAGFWCPECQRIGVWNYDKLAKSSPFYSVWYDSHSTDEDNYYYLDDKYQPLYRKLEK